ncbi:hypothetical protein PHYPSEUDO_012433 [Phytophthora pseudosyringae]|uniref:RRM domain-containing protein n=1 Tax=Phytophthora pseudosyringae TaxID=221518 RepID=A0A8T1WH00_9STRA|nr:hypothetical protein PHYPSEUDO_012433 [Phytophthora pseudosyringae]
MEDEGPMASTKLYVGNLFYELSQQDVEAEFGKFGPIEQCAVKKGYAFVHYEQLEDAEMAVQEMNDKELGGRRLRVAFAVSHGTQRRYDGPPPPAHLAPPGPPPPPMPSSATPLLHSPRFPVNASPNLFVANIPPHIKMSDLDEAFGQFGEVKNVKVLPQARPDAPMSAFVDYTDVASAQKAHSATIVVAGQHLRTDYNFRKNKGDGPRRANRGSFDGNGSYDGEERGGGRPRYDSFDSQPGRKPRYEDEVEDPGHRRHHHHRHSSRHHSSRHTREDPEERGRSGSPPRYRRHSSSSMRRGEEASGMRERSRAYPGERPFGRPNEVEQFQQPERRPQPGYYESRSRGEERVPREYSGRGMDKSPQEYRRYGRPEMSSSRHGSRRGPRNDRSWYEHCVCVP